jgi:alkylhydroperoxidase/carboxymuconolactone decarboxylase family protein YurZ
MTTKPIDQTTKPAPNGDTGEDNVREAAKKIDRALAGLNPEEVARVLGSVAVMNGFYDQATAFIELARSTAERRAGLRP